MYPIQHSPPQQDVEALKTKMTAYNETQIGSYEADKFLISVYDNQKNFIAGLYGLIQYGWLFIDMLWVDEDHRGQGVGKQLISQAEGLAHDKGIQRSRLNTASFQSGPAYYQKLGYRIFAQLPISAQPDIDGRTEHVEYFMRKDW